MEDQKSTAISLPSHGRSIRRYAGMILTVLAVCIVSCQKSGGDNRGEILLSSEFDFQSASVYGYNFSAAVKTMYPSSGDPLPDIIADQFRRVDGTIKPGFTSPDNPNGFSLAGAFESLSASMDFYENELINVDTTVVFSPSSDTVREYQVWVLKTSMNNYVKLHVKETSVVDDPAGEHVEVLMDYYFQPDGTAHFPK